MEKFLKWILFFSIPKIVHGKLSSYSITITNENIPKISCFGCAFNNQGGKIDLSRWSAPEVLRYQHYTLQSDIWSFGCLIWECCALGGTLYPTVNSNDLSLGIKNGTLPERISYVFDDMHQLLLNCWQLEPSERTSFPGNVFIFWFSLLYLFLFCLLFQKSHLFCGNFLLLRVT